MDREILIKEEGKVRKIILRGGREYTGKIISVSNANKKGNSVILIKDKYGATITSTSEDVMAIEELLI